MCLRKLIHNIKFFNFIYMNQIVIVLFNYHTICVKYPLILPIIDLDKKIIVGFTKFIRS